MPLKSVFTLIALNFCCGYLASQDKLGAKFGNVSAQDFATKIYSIDSNANAVILADVGSSAIEGNNKGWFSLNFKHYKRLHILNKNGYEAANVEIRLYSNGDDEEVLDKLKAVTYNLENGKVVETKLDVKANVFKDKINKNWVVKKFTFPNVKEGSIIEFDYTIISDYLQNLKSWEFQGIYPRIWSEYNLRLPEFLGYVFLSQGDKQYDINTPPKSTFSQFRVSDTRGAGSTDYYDIDASVSDYRWVKKNVKPLKEESFTSTLDNHISKIEFQLSEYKHPLTYRRIMGTWDKLSEDLLKSESFGIQLDRDNGWLKDYVKPLIDGVASVQEKAKKIYAFVRDNFTCTNHNRLMIDQNLKVTAKNKSGSEADINLLLTAMLRYADVQADPVILSTRSNGYAYSLYPLLSQYNYVITRMMDGQNEIFLDASEGAMGFGHLPVRCYNGNARVINKEASGVQFNSDALMEVKRTNVFLINDEKGKIVGSYQQLPGYYESATLREKLKDKGKVELQKQFEKGMGIPVAISNFSIDSAEIKESGILCKYDFDLTEDHEEIIYFNPMMGEAMKENPFKSAERLYPVEMPFRMDEIYSLQMEVPQGYVVDELPKSMIVKMNEEGDGQFEYRISQSGNNISFRSRLKIDRTYYSADEYEMLRAFFSMAVKKQAEQIVFKKKG